MKELIVETYKQTVEDNREDFIRTYSILSKLCRYLAKKEILTEEDIQDILKWEEIE